MGDGAAALEHAWAIREHDDVSGPKSWIAQQGCDWVRTRLDRPRQRLCFRRRRCDGRPSLGLLRSGSFLVPRQRRIPHPWLARRASGYLLWTLLMSLPEVANCSTRDRAANGG